jgi:FkbM family methyltransferase
MELNLINDQGGMWRRKDRRDEFIYGELFHNNDYAPVLKMGLGQTPNILDLGAHVGYSVRWFFRAFPCANIIAVEPDPSNFNVLALNNLGHLTSGIGLTLVNAFVAAKDGMGSVIRDGQEPHGYRKGPPTERPTEPPIDCYTVPTLCSAHGLDTIDLLKCDIEGSEVELFNDCRAWIGRVRYALVEVHRKWYGDGFDLPMLYAVLDGQGVKISVLEEKNNCLTFFKVLS